jgi:microcystin degradation protein MlrC
MRIAIGHIIHESNSFSPTPTTYADFTILRAAAIHRQYSEAFNEVGGFLEGGARFGFEPLPLYSATATPAGHVTADAFERINNELLAAFRAAEPFDGILLALHGGHVSASYPHADAETARRMRAAYPRLPIVLTHDPHSHVAPELIEQVDALLMYKTNPHIDMRQTGLRAAELIYRIIRGDVRPAMACRQAPMFVNIVHQNTSAPPLRDLWKRISAVEQQPGVLSADMSLSYQYADVPAMGNVAVVITDGDPQLAGRLADELVARLWDLREELQVSLPGVGEAVTMARRSTNTPVCLVDIGDNIGGGSAGDSTFVLAELVKQDADGWVMAIYDPAGAEACATAGIGAMLALDVGGKSDDMHGAPVRIAGRVTCLHDGAYEEHEPRHGGERYMDQGLTALLELDHGPGRQPSYVLLNSRRHGPTSLQQLCSVGIQPAYMKILVVKAAIAWRAAYEPIAGQIIIADSPGATQVNPARWHYAHARPDLWGLQGW